MLFLNIKINARLDHSISRYSIQKEPTCDVENE